MARFVNMSFCVPSAREWMLVCVCVWNENLSLHIKYTVIVVWKLSMVYDRAKKVIRESERENAFEGAAGIKNGYCVYDKEREMSLNMKSCQWSEGNKTHIYLDIVD